MSRSEAALPLRRTLLFVPGDRPERFEKAVASGADVVCIDLEDGVALANKEPARRNIAQKLPQCPASCEIAVRTNSIRTRAGIDDLLALCNASTMPRLIALPKVESAAEVALVSAVLHDAGKQAEVIAMIESLQGLSQVADIAQAESVAMLALGTADLASEMTVSMDWAPMLLARLQLVQAAKRARVIAIDGVWTNFEDDAGLTSETRRSIEIGFDSKACIHPRQIAVVHRAMRPDNETLANDRELVATFERAGGSATGFKGRMIDKPLADAARRRIALFEKS